jgi:Cleaved Adhesin Domain/Secretion system C-terminal sorting domain
MYMMRKPLIFAFCLLFTAAYSFSQVVSRSNDPGSIGIVPEFVPCEGAAIFEEEFESGIPAGWTILDLDGATPRPEMGLVAGWQPRVGYNDTNNHIAVSPSWYVTPGASDDWLITPQISISGNVCFSWIAYSQDQFYPEDYEIRISTTTADTAGFFAHAALLTVEEEDHDLFFRSLNLSAFSGQSVYLAFRQTSDDQFVLGLDDIKMTTVAAIDAGVYSVSASAGDPGDTLIIRGAVVNYGSDTITSVNVNWNIDGGVMNSDLIAGFSLAPNDTMQFVHPTRWITDTTIHIYNLCAWTSDPNAATDAIPSNDTTCTSVNIGNAIGIDRPALFSGEVSVFPNPAAGVIFLNYAGEARFVNWQLFTMEGMNLNAGVAFEGLTSEVAIESLSPGLYFIRFTTPEGGIFTQKFVVE